MLSRQEVNTMSHLANAQYWDRPAGGNTGRLFLAFGGPVCADRFSNCPLDRVLTYKNLIYLLNLQFAAPDLPLRARLHQVWEIWEQLPDRGITCTYAKECSRTGQNSEVSFFSSTDFYWHQNPTTLKTQSRKYLCAHVKSQS